jgi:hypothetical protein
MTCEGYLGEKILIADPPLPRLTRRSVAMNECPSGTVGLKTGLPSNSRCKILGSRGGEQGAKPKEPGFCSMLDVLDW